MDEYSVRLSMCSRNNLAGNEMPRDPVCEVVLDERTAKFKIKFGGETHYFCSITCKKRFKRSPNKFVK